MATYEPQFLAPQGRGRPERETDHPLEVVDFSEGIHLEQNPLNINHFTKFVLNSRSEVNGILQRRKDTKAFGTNVYSIWNKLSNLSNNPTGIASRTGIAFSSDETYLAIGSNDSDMAYIYKRSGDTFTKLTTLSQSSSIRAISLAFDPTDTYLAVASNGGDFLYVYKRDGDTFTKLTIATLPTKSGFHVEFNEDGTRLLWSSDAEGTAGKSLMVYDISGDTFTYDTSTPGFDAYDIKEPFFVDDDIVIIGNSIDASGNNAMKYDSSWTQTIFATQPTQTIKTVVYSKSNSVIALGVANSSYVYTYEYNTDDISQIGGLDSTSISASIDAIAIHDKFISATSSTDNEMYMYNASGVYLVRNKETVYSPTSGSSVEFSPTGRYLVYVGDSTPSVCIYKRLDRSAGTVYMTEVLDKFGQPDTLFRLVNGDTGVWLQYWHEGLKNWVSMLDLSITDIGNADDRNAWYGTSVDIGGTQRMYFTNGEENLQYTDGSSVNTVTGVKGRYIATLENIMMLGHLTITHHINQAVFTKAGTHQFYTDLDSGYSSSSNVISVDGEITQVVSFGGVFYIFTKDAGLWEVDMKTAIPRKISEVGTNAPRSVGVGFDFMVWLDKTSIWMLPLGGQVVKVSDNIQELLDNSFKVNA